VYINLHPMDISDANTETWLWIVMHCNLQIAYTATRLHVSQKSEADVRLNNAAME